MNPLFFGTILEIGKDLINRFMPDPDKKLQAEAELIRLAAAGELQEHLAQLEINLREAQHQSVFVAGWRPFFGWAGGVGFVYATIGQPLLAWLAAVKGISAPPDINVDLLWVVITGLLGIGGMRTYERVTGRVTK